MNAAKVEAARVNAAKVDAAKVDAARVNAAKVDAAKVEIPGKPIASQARSPCFELCCAELTSLSWLLVGF